MKKIEQQQKMEQLARDVLILSRNTLLVNLRFLDAALIPFEALSDEDKRKDSKVGMGRKS